MKQIINNKPIAKIKPLFGNIDEYTLRYNQLKKLFNIKSEYLLFAEPITVSEKKEITWFTEHAERPVPFHMLSEDHKIQAMGILKEKMELIREATKQLKTEDLQQIQHTLEIYFEIPSAEDIIAFIKNNEVEEIQLIQWGCISEAYDAKRGLISKLIPAHWINMQFKVVYNDGTLAANIPIMFEYGNKQTEMISGADGSISLGELALYTRVKASQKKEDGLFNTQKYTNYITEPHLYKINKPQSMNFLVMTEQNIPIPSINVTASYSDKQIPITANADGKFSLSNIAQNAEVIILPPPTGYEIITNKFIYDEPNKEYIVVLREIVPGPSYMRFKVIEKKDNPVEGAQIKVNYNNQELQLTTDANGYAGITGIPLQTKVKARARKQRKRGKKKFLFTNPNNDHIIKIRKPISLWWLLLLLLPLLLLIQWHKEVQFKVIDTVNPSQTVNATVYFTYPQRAFFDFQSKRFFTANIIHRQNATESTGLSRFPGVRVTLYQYLFYGFERTFAVALAQCYGSDTLRPTFNSLKNKRPKEIPMGHLKRDYVFKVFNKDNKEPIPNAVVTIIYKFGNTSKTVTAKSDVAGNALLKDLPVCADFTIKSTAYGYYDEIIKTNGSDVFYKNKAQIPMRPLKQSLVFYIKNSRNREPIPGATAYLFIDGKNAQQVTTNVNGAVSMVGQGVFENVHIIKPVLIKGQMTGFYDSTMTGIAGQLIKADAAKRTLYLRPKATNVDFKVVDAAKRNPISGATVKITINGVQRTVYSNSSGVVSVAGLNYGDKISILATADPNYQPNNYCHDERIDDFINGTISRDIPMFSKTPPPPPPPPPGTKPCNGGTDGTHENSSDVSTSYNLGKPNGTFTFEYFTDRAPDQLIIYNAGQKIWEYYGATKTSTKYAQISYTDPIITVRVVGGTRWRYSVHCPN